MGQDPTGEPLILGDDGSAETWRAVGAGGRREGTRVMATARSVARHWSLGAVLAERTIDPRTYLLVVRTDAGLAAALDLRRRLLGLQLVGPHHAAGGP